MEMLNIIYFDKLDSTNTQIKENINLYKHGDCVFTSQQTNGRGQLGSVWKSEDHLNLTCSFLVQWSKLKVIDQFQISKLVAIVLLSEIKLLIPNKNVSIKWPNDIYVDNKKIGGILIENTIHNEWVEKSIIGIGVNINQIKFPDFNSKQAISLKQITGIEYTILKLLKTIGEALYTEVSLGRIHDFRTLNKIYLNNLYYYNRERKYIDADGEFIGVITGVDSTGKLLVKNNSILKRYDLKEIQFLPYID